MRRDDKTKNPSSRASLSECWDLPKGFVLQKIPELVSLVRDDGALVWGAGHFAVEGGTADP